jgi:hypothetical protein
VEIWTAKEAVLKTSGEGFSGVDGFGVLARLDSAFAGAPAALDEWASIAIRDARTGAAHGVWRRWLGIHVIAIAATDGNEGKPRLTLLKLRGE